MDEGMRRPRLCFIPAVVCVAQSQSLNRFCHPIILTITLATMSAWEFMDELLAKGNEAYEQADKVCDGISSRSPVRIRKKLRFWQFSPLPRVSRYHPCLCQGHMS